MSRFCSAPDPFTSLIRRTSGWRRKNSLRRSISIHDGSAPSAAMKLRQLGERLRPSLIAVLAGWASGDDRNLAHADSSRSRQIASVVRWFCFGLLPRARWFGPFGRLAVAAGGWLLGLIPVILLVPEDWLLGHRGVQSSSLRSSHGSPFWLSSTFGSWCCPITPWPSECSRSIHCYSLSTQPCRLLSIFVSSLLGWITSREHHHTPPTLTHRIREGSSRAIESIAADSVNLRG